MVKQSLHTTLKRLIIGLFSLFVIVTIFFSSLFTYNSFINEKEKLQEDIINSKKYLMKNQVDFFIADIKISRKELRIKTKKELQKRVEIAHNIAQNLYKKHPYDSNIKSIIVESLRELKFYDIGDQYVFMTKLDGTFLLVPGLKHLEGKNVFNLTTKSNKQAVKIIIDKVKTEKKGYIEYKWQNHSTLKFNTKISYVKYFEPFDCFIGTGVFTKDMEEKLQDNFIEKIEGFRFGENMDNYIFAGTYKGISLSYPSKNKNLYNITDMNGLKVVQELIKTAQEGSGFLKYVIPVGKEEKLEKLSYVVGIDAWQIYVGIGETFKEINKTIEAKKAKLLSKLYLDVLLILSLGILFLVLFYYLLRAIKKSLHTDTKNLLESISSLVYKNKEIDLNKIEFSEFEQISKQTNQLLKDKIEIENNLKEKELLLYQQSKMAAMGELLENIAHQWRQPLSLITTSSTGIQAKKEYGQLDDEFLNKSLENINTNAEYLSSTIDDFRNFFATSILKEYFKIGKLIDKTLKLLHMRNQKSSVTVVQDIVDLEINSYKNQILQVLLVILNNAYDVLQNIEGTKLLFIQVSNDEHSLYINIGDNGGGIEPKTLAKIFEPYFTTKHKSHGTGIGLYMAIEIIKKQLDGEIVATNKTFIHKDKEYRGANFTITIPLIKD